MRDTSAERDDEAHADAVAVTDGETVGRSEGGTVTRDDGDALLEAEGRDRVASALALKASDAVADADGVA